MSSPISSVRSNRQSVTPTVASRLSAVHLERRTPTPSNTRRRQNSHLHSTLFQTSLSDLEMPSNEDSAKAGEVFRYEWPIPGLQDLKERIEDTPGSMWTIEREYEEADTLPDVLRGGKVIGPGWFKLDLARSIPHPHSPKTPVEEVINTIVEERLITETLTLYVGALSIDTGPTEIRYPVSIFVGIRPIDPPSAIPTGSNYFWHSISDWEFSPANEFWHIQLPRLSDLLADQTLQQQDGFALCIEMATPTTVGPSFTRPDRVDIDASLINGLRSLLDSPTGDVMFVCLEHAKEDKNAQAIDNDLGDSEERDSNKAHPLSRKRIVYAHSDILKAASGFFRSLLTGDFEEAGRARRNDLRHMPVLVDDAEYETVYWVLRHLYTREIAFSDVEDVRRIMDQHQIEKSEMARAISEPSRYSGPAEWSYRRLQRDGDDMEDLEDLDVRTVKSSSSVGTRHSVISPSPSSGNGQVDTRATTAMRSSVTKPGTANTPTKAGANRAPLASPAATRINPVSKPALPASVPTAKGVSTNTASKTSPSLSRPSYPTRSPDPHSHPCQAPLPASALSVYMLSHRYGLDRLSALAKVHIMDRLTPENCMPMLLATYRYDVLHAEVLAFVIARWDAVQVSEELAKCVGEVSAGVWGETGGRVLLGLFRRL